MQKGRMIMHRPHHHAERPDDHAQATVCQNAWGDVATQAPKPDAGLLNQVCDTYSVLRVW